MGRVHTHQPVPKGNGWDRNDSKITRPQQPPRSHRQHLPHNHHQEVPVQTLQVRITYFLIS